MVTQRLLFVTVDMSEVSLSDTTRFLSFARVVFRWPQVGSQVRKLTLNTKSMTTGVTPSRETFGSFTGAMERFLRQETGQRNAGLGEEISSMGIGCILALLLTHTRQLEILRLIMDRTELPPIVYLAHRMTGYLHRLESLMVDCRPAFNLADLSPLIGLPRLQEFSCWGCIGNNPSVAEDAVDIFRAPEKVNISFLKFRESSMDERCMTDLVISCPKLHSLIYEATTFPDTGYTHFSPGQLQEVLRSHHSHVLSWFFGTEIVFRTGQSFQ
ncbi:hypothetical protein FE257_003003 [Aspergillus nanangensis]|uniref:Uncharacterized protein n=1 Tax=Aspergillus nanangensis TaxID=2582783 RepID=A0AAD4CC52_ASPNN|nr:hypothetical protein FE257_003003 [Aspergillus nanangensis]